MPRTRSSGPDQRFQHDKNAIPVEHEISRRTANSGSPTRHETARGATAAKHDEAGTVTDYDWDHVQSPVRFNPVDPA